MKLIKQYVWKFTRPNGRMKTILAILLLASLALAKDIDVANYPLKAKVLASESNGGMSISPVMNNSTGVITGSSVGYWRNDREEMQIEDTIYITTLLRGCHHCVDLIVGNTYPAQLGHRRKFTTITFLQPASKGDGFKLVTLKVIGERAK